MSELIFKPDKKHRDRYLRAAHFAHPAKMNLQLQRWLILHYSKRGDVILDPMAGSGTVLIACTMGRHVICVELEQKFIKMMEDNWEKIKTIGPEMGSEMGTPRIIQGDARNLEGVLADAIITSPPYGNRLSDGAVHDGDPQRMSYRQSLADVVITSPPYSEGLGHQHRKYGRDIEASKSIQPPEYSRHKDNIGNLPYGQIDSIITSPPYEGSLSDGHKKGRTNGTEFTYAGQNPQNIGNLMGNTYLQAMLQVYQQCHNVLKDSGVMCLVTKNFIRNRQIVRLDLDTIKLCEAAGFRLVERHRRRLTSSSFWRVIYRQKYPDAPEITHEDILVFAKAEG